MTLDQQHRVADLRSALNLRLYMLHNGWLTGEKREEAARHIAAMRLELYTLLSQDATHESAEIIPLDPPIARAV